jgi:nucleotidyltransferase substrate binding protein (TIGR01987 family)
MAVDISLLERAIARLAEAWEVYQADPSQALIRDGLIQRFEFTYELSHKLLRRYLRDNSTSSGDIDSMSLADVIRVGNENGLLLGDWPIWRHYRDMRSRTSHAYDEPMALKVVEGIPDFLAEARHMYRKIQSKLAE